MATRRSTTSHSGNVFESFVNHVRAQPSEGRQQPAQQMTTNLDRNIGSIWCHHFSHFCRYNDPIDWLTILALRRLNNESL